VNFVVLDYVFPALHTHGVVWRIVKQIVSDTIPDAINMHGWSVNSVHSAKVVDVAVFHDVPTRL
jgi:hypothetical protein